jgi:ElaB/YqjD/DUF883 family membrane-anchored ribosome-binding protein
MMNRNRKRVLMTKLQGSEWQDALARKGSRALSAVAYRVGDAALVVRHSLRRGYYAAADAADEAIHTMKRNPLRSAGLAFGAGLALGWLTSRNGKKHLPS